MMSRNTTHRRRIPRIFISYRIEDTREVAFIIYEHLVRAFNEDNVFFDKKGIASGEDWHETIRRNLRRSNIVLALIGKDWLKTDESGRRRIDDEKDVLREEIETALKDENIKTFPVLINNTPAPKPDLLPESIRPLLNTQGLSVRYGQDFDHDIEVLVQTIRKISLHEPVGSVSAPEKTTNSIVAQLLDTFPGLLRVGGTVYLALEIGFDRLAAQIYQVESDLPHLIDHYDDQTWAYDYYELVAGVDDPLIHHLLLEFGVFWSPVREITFRNVVDRLAPHIDNLMERIRQKHKLSHVTILGKLCSSTQIRELVYQSIVGDFTESKFTQNQLEWHLPLREVVQTYYEELDTVALHDYYDLIELAHQGNSLVWSRHPLFGPRTSRKIDEQRLMVTPNTKQCFFFVVRYSDPGDDVDILSLPANRIVYAAEINNSRERQTLNYSVTIDENLKLTLVMPGVEIIDRQEQARKILTDWNQLVRVQSASMQTVFAIDGTLNKSLFRRCVQLIEQFAEAKPPEFFWLTYQYDHGRAYSAIGEEFVDTRVFQERMREFQRTYEQQYHPSGEPIRVNRMLEHLDKLDWASSGAKYFVFFCNRAPSHDIQSEVEILRSRGLHGCVIWLQDGGTVSVNHADVKPYSQLGNIVISDLTLGESNQFGRALSFLNEHLIPSTFEEIRLDGIPWPLRNSLHR